MDCKCKQPLLEKSISHTISLAKNVLKHPSIVSLITGSIVKADGQLLYSEEEIFADGLHFVVYLPRQGSTSFGIVLAIQENLTEASMKRSIEKCLQVQSQYAIHAYFLCFCNTVSPPVQSFLSPTPDNPYWLTLDCSIWTEKCIVISNDAVDGKFTYDPMTILAMYISNNEERIKKLESSDPTVKLLHTISDDNTSF